MLENIFATIEIERTDENTTDALEDTSVSTKVSSYVPADNVGKATTANTVKQKSLRKEIKNTKAQMVRVSKDLPKSLIM